MDRPSPKYFIPPSGYDTVVDPGDEIDVVEGVGSEVTSAEDPEALPDDRLRLEAGLQDTLDLSDWRMPGLYDYAVYYVMYGGLMALAVYIIVRFRDPRIVVLWGGYLIILVVLAAFMVRSLSYRSGTLSKSFMVSTLDLEEAVETALEDVGLAVDSKEEPRNRFMRPLIGVYRLRGMGFTITVEGRPHLRRKVVRVGRFVRREGLEEAMRLCDALDREVEEARGRKVARALFK